MIFNNHTRSYYQYQKEQQEGQVVDYDDVDEDDDTLVQHHRKQADNISATSVFTAADHFDNQDEDDDDSSSTENLRHGYLPNHPFSSVDSDKKKEILSEYKKKLNLTHSLDWEDYKPQYRQMNDSYATVKKGMYINYSTT